MPRHDYDGNTDPLSDEKETDEALMLGWFDSTFDEQEAALTRSLSKTNPQDPGGAWWEKWIARYGAFFTPFITQMAIESSQGHQAQFGVGIDFDTIADQAENWASTYGFNLVTGLNNGTRRTLQRGLAEFSAGRLDYTGLVNSYATKFTRARAENIAMTETTKAYFNGMRIYREQVGALGVRTDVIWHAEPDACPICLPNHGVLQSTGLWTVPEMPAHPRCHCFPEIVQVPA